MGFFNFLYKLTNIFSNKRKLKVFIILSLILILVFCWSRGCFAATPQEAQALTNYQLKLQESCFNYISYLYRSGFYDSSKLMELANRLKSNNVYVTTSVNSDVQFLIYTYKINVSSGSGAYNTVDDFTIDGSWELGVMSGGVVSGTEYPCKLADFQGNVYTIKRENVGTANVISSPTWTHFYLPDSCYCVRSTSVNEFLDLVNAYSELPTTYNTSDAELQAITQQGFDDVTLKIQQQTNTMTNSINNASTSITNSVDNLTNTITDTTTDDNQVQFAQDNNQDLTSGFFTNLFNSFKNAFTNNNIVGVEFNIPFTNSSFTFSNRYVRSLVEQNESFQPIVVLATAFWWFALGYYVILDIYKKINAIKSGDLTNIENDNITTDLM